MRWMFGKDEECGQQNKAKKNQPSSSVAAHLDVRLERHRPHRRLEVEEALAGDAEPRREVVSVGERRREADEAHRAADLGGDVAHAADDDLQDGAAVFVAGGQRARCRYAVCVCVCVW